MQAHISLREFSHHQTLLHYKDRRHGLSSDIGEANRGSKFLKGLRMLQTLRSSRNSPLGSPFQHQKLLKSAFYKALSLCRLSPLEVLQLFESWSDSLNLEWDLISLNHPEGICFRGTLLHSCSFLLSHNSPKHISQNLEF